MIMCLFRFWKNYDFYYPNTTDSTNIRLKWISICFNINYVNGTMEVAMNGEILRAKRKKAITWNNETNFRNLHIGRYFGYSVPIIGKIADINMWDR